MVIHVVLWFVIGALFLAGCLYDDKKADEN
jgi:hypothetical protein